MKKMLDSKEQQETLVTFTNLLRQHRGSVIPFQFTKEEKEFIAYMILACLGEEIKALNAAPD